MIEVVVKNYLDTALDGIPVVLEVPKTQPAKFYLVEKTGGGLDDHISKSTIVIQSYADSLYTAAAMSEEVIALMKYGLVEQEEVVSVSLNSEYNYTDTTEKKYRYQAVFDIIHY